MAKQSKALTLEIQETRGRMMFTVSLPSGRSFHASTWEQVLAYLTDLSENLKDSSADRATRAQKIFALLEEIYQNSSSQDNLTDFLADSCHCLGVAETGVSWAMAETHYDAEAGE